MVPYILRVVRGKSLVYTSVKKANKKMTETRGFTNNAFGRPIWAENSGRGFNEGSPITN